MQLKDKIKVGDIVTIDADNEDWGRVTGKAEILDIYCYTIVTVHAFGIRADIVIDKSEINATVQPELPKMKDILFNLDLLFDIKSIQEAKDKLESLERDVIVLREYIIKAEKLDREAG